MNFSFVSMKSFPEVTPQNSIKIIQTFTTIRVFEYWILIHKNYKKIILAYTIALIHNIFRDRSETDQIDGSVGGCSLSFNLSKALLIIMYFFVLQAMSKQYVELDTPNFLKFLDLPLLMAIFDIFINTGFFLLSIAKF